MDSEGALVAAVFGLLGVVIGGLLSFFSQWGLRKRDYDLRVWDRLLDRRIGAHQAVVDIALRLRVMIGLGFDDDGALARFPEVLQSKEYFDDWVTECVTTVNVISPWLSGPALREVFFFQDYVTNLCQNTVGWSEAQFAELARELRLDLIDLSQSLERAGYAFFQSDVRKLKLRDADEPFKHPEAEAQRRLSQTSLFKELGIVQAPGSGDSS